MDLYLIVPLRPRSARMVRRGGRPGRVVQPEPAGRQHGRPVCGASAPTAHHAPAPRRDPAGPRCPVGRGRAVRPAGADPARCGMGEPRGPAGGGRGLRRPRRGHELLAAPGGRDGAAGPHPAVRQPPGARRRRGGRAPRYRSDPGLGTDRCRAAPGAMAEELAGLVAQAEGGLVARLPRQLVHGDFWDDNMLFRHGRPVLLCDFDFMGERARVDDLALTLWCAAATSAMRAPRRRSVLGWAAWSPPTTPAWTCPGGRACRAAAGDGSPAPVVDRWLGGAPGRSGGGARPRRQRRTRVGRGTAAHDRVGPLARHVRLSRTPRPPWPRHPGRTSTGLGDQVMLAGSLSPTGDTSGASLTATAGRNPGANPPDAVKPDTHGTLRLQTSAAARIQ